MDTGLLTILVGQIYAAKIAAWSAANRFEEPPKLRIMRDALADARELMFWVEAQVRSDARAKTTELTEQQGEGVATEGGLR